MEFKLADIMYLRQSGIYCLENKEKKIIQIWYSRNILESLNNILKNVYTGEYGMLKDDINNIQFSILKLIDNDKNGKVILSGLIDKYRNDGYIMYKDTNLINYKLGSGPGIIRSKMYYLVYLENRSKKKQVIGVFDNKDKADTWMNITYPNGIIDHLVCCDNEFSHLINDIT